MNNNNNNSNNNKSYQLECIVFSLWIQWMMKMFIIIISDQMYWITFFAILLNEFDLIWRNEHFAMIAQLFERFFCCFCY